MKLPYSASSLCCPPSGAQSFPLFGVTIMRRYSLTLLAAAAVGLATSQLASASDLPPPRAVPPRAPAAYVPPPPPPFTWTGLYIGGNVGAAWTHGEVTDSFGIVNNSNS